MRPRILGVADAIVSDVADLGYETLSAPARVDALFQCAVARLLEFLGMTRASLIRETTDFVGFGSPNSGVRILFDTVDKAESLGITGVRTHLIDHGGASVAASMRQCLAILKMNPEAVILVAGADAPRSFHTGGAGYIRDTADFGAHARDEAPHGGMLIALYALLGKRFLFDHQATPEDLVAIAKRFRLNAVGNPRAAKGRGPVTPEELAHRVADPYSNPMIAVVTDHAFATMVMAEPTYERLSRAGALRRDLPALHIASATQTMHSQWMSHKGGMHSPSEATGRAAFAEAGLSPADVDVAWIYDCFAGMIPMQAANYFNLSGTFAVESLKDGELRVGRKSIPVNTNGGILNYQAAMMISGATGLLDALSHFGLAVDCSPPPGSRVHMPKVAFLGGNGGIDSINAAAIFTTDPKESGEPAPAAERPDLYLHRVGAEEGETGAVLASTTVHFNPSGAISTPYTLALVRFEHDRVCLANLCAKSGELLKSDEGIEFEVTRVKMKKIGGLLRAIV